MNYKKSKRMTQIAQELARLDEDRREWWQRFFTTDDDDDAAWGLLKAEDNERMIKMSELQCELHELNMPTIKRRAK
jgi:hypothetical protein